MNCKINIENKEKKTIEYALKKNLNDQDRIIALKYNKNLSQLTDLSENDKDNLSLILNCLQSVTTSGGYDGCDSVPIHPM